MSTPLYYDSILVPENRKGKATNLQESVTTHTTHEAIKIFERACIRLKNVTFWHEVSGHLSAEFCIADNMGSIEQRTLQQDDYIRIDIPGPGTKEGDGYDWVKVVNIQEKTDQQKNYRLLAVTLAASNNPVSGNNEIAHFFEEGATSTFILQLQNKTVSASYYGRNEVPNTDVERLTDKVRNALVGMAAYVGISEIHWKALLKGFLKEH